MKSFNDLEKLHREAKAAIEATETIDDLRELKRTYLGRKGMIAKLFEELPKVSLRERPEYGRRLNAIRQDLVTTWTMQEVAILEKLKAVQQKEQALDVTLPGRRIRLGRRHILTRTVEEIQQIFLSMGFEIVVGPEVETEEFNFERLNTPRDHPARDAQDTFYISDELLLRTQTTAVDARIMLGRTPPMRVLTTGRCYRRDASDPTHMPVFHQVDGFMVGEKITMADLKGVLAAFARQFFGPNTATRFVPGYFPFTEPSAETLVYYRDGWLEMGGCGMFHPRVLEAGRIDPVRYRAFAFGWGVERPAMVRYGIPDLRLFWENDLRMLEQF